MVRLASFAAARSRFLSTIPGARSAIVIPDVRQQETYDCGAACTYAVCLYYRRGPASETDFIAALGTNPRDGTSPECIVAFLGSLGLSVHADSMTIGELAGYIRSGIPVICPIQADAPDGERGGHYVVACGFAGGVVTFHDPVRGLMSIAADEFERRWHDVGADGTEYIRYGIAVSDA